MLSSRRLRVIVPFLIVGVLAVGFILTNDFVQEATASNSDECKLALAACYMANVNADLACLLHGKNSKECVQAAGRAASKCFQAVIICEN